VQIEAYRDMIAPVVDAFKYLTQVQFFFFGHCTPGFPFLHFLVLFLMFTLKILFMW
jgi:hypothetical protein